MQQETTVYCLLSHFVTSSVFPEAIAEENVSRSAEKFNTLFREAKSRYGQEDLSTIQILSEFMGSRIRYSRSRGRSSFRDDCAYP